MSGTTEVTELVQSEWISDVIQLASKDQAVFWRFTKEYDRTAEGASPTVSLPREVSDVSTSAEIDALDQSEGSDMGSETTFETNDTSFGVSEYGIRRDLTDDAIEDNILGSNLFDFIVMSGATDLAIGYDDDLAALAGNFSTTVGTSDADMALADMVEAVAKLGDNNMGEGGGSVFVLGNQQKFDYFTAGLNGTGTLLASYVQPPGDAQPAPENFLGTFMQTEVWYSTLTDTANGGADTTGALFHRGDGARNPRSAAIATSVKRRPTPRMEYDASGRATEVVITMRRGSAENIDESGVSIITDAD